jgi:Mrp family chromosome partitioning ATPase
MTTAVDRARRVPLLDVSAGRHLARRTVVMVASPGLEPTRAAVALNLATVCAEIGQRVAVVSTSGIDAQEAQGRPRELTGPPTEDVAGRSLPGLLQPADVQPLLDDSGIPGVSLLDLRHFVAHPTQVVIRVPELLSALREIVDVVILDVPSILTVHHGQGLAPLADVVLVVGERRLTTLDQLRQTHTILRRLGAPVVGMALTAESFSSTDWGDWDAGWEADRDSRRARDRRTENPSGDEDQEAVVTRVATGGTNHRKRRPVVEHEPVVGHESVGGSRSEYPAEANAPTFPET